jgi:hypothetical protein
VALTRKRGSGYLGPETDTDDGTLLPKKSMEVKREFGEFRAISPRPPAAADTIRLLRLLDAVYGSYATGHATRLSA